MTLQQPRFSLNLKTHIVSDTHFWHQKLVSIGMRPCQESIDTWLFEGWRAQVFPGEDVLHLGDIGFGYPKDAAFPQSHYTAQIRSLPGNVFLVRGNHDRWTVTKYQKEYGWVSWYGPPMGVVLLWTDDRTNIRYALSHGPLTDPSTADRWDVNIHGHIHTNGYPRRAEPFVSTHRYHCICVEYMNYRPQTLGTIIDQAEDTFAKVGFHPSHDDTADYVALEPTLVYVHV